MKPLPQREQGAALLAVLAMVLLLAAFASLGLARLRAATSQIGNADAGAIAANVATSATATAVELVHGWKADSRRTGALRPIRIDTGAGVAELHFRNAFNCFNLNSLATTSAANAAQRAQSTPGDFARLLVAAGIPPHEAGPLAQATAGRLQQTGVLWADASEWVTVAGVTAAHWALAGPLLCALPNREAMALNLNELTAAQAPLLAGAGLSADEARRALASRPKAGWGSPGEFWQQASMGGVPQTAMAQAAGTSSRWISLDLVARTPDTTLRRQLLLDTARQPARLASAVWKPAGGQG